MGNTRSRDACGKISNTIGRPVPDGVSSDVCPLFKRQRIIHRRERNSYTRGACEKPGNASDQPDRIIPSDEMFIDDQKCHFLQLFDVVSSLFKREGSFSKTEINGRTKEACAKLGNAKDQPVRIIPSDEVFIPGGKCYLLPYDAVSTLFKWHSIDKTDFAELILPFAAIYSSPAKILPTRSKKRARKDKRCSKCLTRASTKKFQDAMQEESEQKLQKGRHDVEDTAPPHGCYTLAEHINASSESDLAKPHESANDEEEIRKHQLEVAMLIDSARALLLSKQQAMRARRRNTAGRRRTRWVPKLQTVQECSP